MCHLRSTLEKQLKIFGLNRESQEQFSQTLSSMFIPQSLEPFKQKILNYLQAEMALLDDHQTVLATSDVIESIAWCACVMPCNGITVASAFGKYKCFSQRCPLKDLRSMLLTIPLTTMNLTLDVITKALETVRGADLSQWINDVFGQSMLSKRKTLLAAANSDMKTV